jgi:hypothetical protein
MLSELPSAPHTPPPSSDELRVMKLCWMDTVDPVPTSTPPPPPRLLNVEFASIRQLVIVVTGAEGESTPIPAPVAAVFSVTVLLSR